jgi:hypothetical protein
MKLNMYFLMVALCVSSGAHANERGNGGGGELLFRSMVTDISAWLVNNNQNDTLAVKLKLAGISSGQLLNKFEDAVKLVDSNVKFIPKDKLSSECSFGDSIACQLQVNSRTCMNAVVNTRRIECNEELFDARPGDEQFGLVFHEYLGIAGLEANDSENFSQYPISSNLMKFANPRTTTRWELSDGGECSGLDLDLQTLIEDYKNDTNTALPYFNDQMSNFMRESSYLRQLVPSSDAQSSFSLGDASRVGQYAVDVTQESSQVGSLLNGKSMNEVKNLISKSSCISQVQSQCATLAKRYTDDLNGLSQVFVNSQTYFTNLYPIWQSYSNWVGAHMSTAVNYATAQGTINTLQINYGNVAASLNIYNSSVQSQVNELQTISGQISTCLLSK